MRSDPELQAAEIAMNSAIEQDLKYTYDEDVKVLSYLVVSEVMLEDGTVTTRWSYTADVPDYRRWGMLEWLRRRFEDTR